MYLQRAAASPAGRSCEFLYRPAAAIPPWARRGMGGPSRPRPVRYNGRAALAGQARRPASPATCLLSNLLTNCRRGRRQLFLACTLIYFPSFISDAGVAAGGRAGLRSPESAGIQPNAEWRCVNARRRGSSWRASLRGNKCMAARGGQGRAGEGGGRRGA